MQDNLNDFWKVIVEYWLLIAMVITTVVMAMFRTAKQHGKIDYLEAAMCAIFAYGVYLVLGWFKIPPEASVLVGGFVGWLGTARVAAIVQDKLGFESKDDNKE